MELSGVESVLEWSGCCGGIGWLVVLGLTAL